MIADKSISWGPPFDSLPPPSSDAEVRKKELVTVAKRAEKFVRAMDSRDEAKYVNLDLLSTHFCLNRVADSSDSNCATVTVDKKEWKLNKKALMVKHQCFCGEMVAIDLPHRKDLTKRAKVVLGSLMASSVEKKGDDLKHDPKQSHGFTILDQSDVSNALLAELMRGVLKSPVNNKEGKEFAKTLCTAALAEAQKRVDDAREFVHDFDSSQKPMKMKCENLNSVLKHIRHVETSLSMPPRLYKNVLRVILGDSPIPGKSDGEPLFPPRRDPKASSNISPKVHCGSRMSYGHQAIEKSSLRMNQLGDSARPTNCHSPYLCLTAVENLILSAACSHGLPVWQEDWKKSVFVDNDSSGSEMSWKTFGCRLEKDVSLKLSRERSVHSWESLCYEQVLEYKAEPETLAKKTILMLSKLMKRIGLAVPGLKSERGLSVKVLKWFGGQVVSWSLSLHLVDQANEPLALTAVDFLDDMKSEDRSEVLLASCLDKQACRDVFAQISSMAKLRSSFMSSDRDSVLAMIQQAVMNLDPVDGGWKGHLPPAWNAGQDDGQLLTTLLCLGFKNVVYDKMTVSVCIPLFLSSSVTLAMCLTETDIRLPASRSN